MTKLVVFPPASPLSPSFDIPNSVASIGESAFSFCTGLTQVTIPNSVTSIGRYAFYNCTGLTGKLVIPNSVTSIGNYAFYGCTGLTQVTIPESVTEIGSSAFYNCTGLTEVNFNATACTSAGSSSSNRAFYGCSNISKVTFGDNVTMIPDYLCYGLTGLTEVTIPESVTSIGERAFYNCTGLASIYSLNPEPPACGTSVFYYVDTYTCLLYVPEGTLEAYFSAYQWRDFFKIVDNLPNGIEDILTDGNGHGKAVGYYTTDGKKVSQPQQGINIVRYSDGTAKKVLVK